MLRLSPYAYHRPRSVADALALKDAHGDAAMYVAGGTDLVPNLKHGLFEPEHVISLRGVKELRGIAVVDDVLVIGAGETLTSVAESKLVRTYAPSLAEAAAHVAGPQLRNAGTIGGNVCLDTRCTYYNQTQFWREALGFCLKKDGTVCHVTKVGKKCVAAHSADTPPVLMALGASVRLVAAEGERELAVDELFVSDGIWNTKRAPGEILSSVRVPIRAGRREGYAKLRQRKSIDFPLLTVAVAAEMEEGRVLDIRGVVTALGSRPKVLTGWSDLAVGRVLDDDLVDALAERAHQQCRPLENIIVDPEWRRAMVPIYVRRALGQLTG